MCPSVGLSKHRTCHSSLCEGLQSHLPVRREVKAVYSRCSARTVSSALTFLSPKKRPAMHHGRCILEAMDKANGELVIVHHGTFVSVLRPLCGLTRTNWSHNNGWIMDVNKSFCSQICLARIRSTHSH